MVEGGPETARRFLRAGLVDRAIIVTAPVTFEIPVLSGIGEVRARVPRACEALRSRREQARAAPPLASRSNCSRPGSRTTSNTNTGGTTSSAGADPRCHGRRTRFRT